MSKAKRKAMNKSRGPVGKTAVVGIKDRDSNEVRAEVVQRTNGATLQGFIRQHVEPGSTVYTDDAAAYPRDAGVRARSGQSHRLRIRPGYGAHNGIESFWSMIKRAHDGTFHKMSPKHLQRYVSEFAGKHNIRDSGTLAQMRDTVAGLVGRNLLYRDLIADNGLSSGSGRRGSTQRNRARASASGVAPAKSTFGSSFGRYVIGPNGTLSCTP